MSEKRENSEKKWKSRRNDDENFVKLRRNVKNQKKKIKI